MRLSEALKIYQQVYNHAEAVKSGVCVAREDALRAVLEAAGVELAPEPESLPAALAEALSKFGSDWMMDRPQVAALLACAIEAMPAVRRELLAEVEAEPAATERVEKVLDLLFLCRGSDCAGFTGHEHRVDCAAYWRQKTGIDAALRRLHFGAVAGEVRLRRVLLGVLATADKDVKIARLSMDETEWECPECGSGGACADDCSRNALLGALDDAEAALARPPSEPAAALEALLGELEGAGTEHTIRTQRVARRLRKAVGWEEERRGSTSRGERSCSGDCGREVDEQGRQVHDADCPAHQPPASGEPAVLEAPCAWCGYNGPGYWQARSHSSSCPWHTVGGKYERERLLRWIVVARPDDADQTAELPSWGDFYDAVAGVLGSGRKRMLAETVERLIPLWQALDARARSAAQPAELPADWREAVEGALADLPESAWGFAVVEVSVARRRLFSALAPLVLGERLRAERLRRALESLYEEDDPKTRRRLFEEALSAAPPDAALAELLELPGEWEKRARAAETEETRETVAALVAAGTRATRFRQCAHELRAVLAKLGFPAGEGAGDG